MRLTVLHADKGLPGARATDVDAAPGTTAATLRDHVARLTGRPEWASAARTLTADGVPVDGAHPVGLAPLVPGAVLAVDGGTVVPPEQRALAAPAHVAVVAGPDSGTLLVLTQRRACAVGPDGQLVVRDELWGAAPLLVRLRPSRARGRRAECDPVMVVQIRTAGAAHLVRQRSGRLRRVPRWRWVRWPLGAQLYVGTSILALRDAPGALATDGRSGLRGPSARPARPVDGSGDRRRRRGQLTAMLASMLGPLVTGAVLAIAVHQPLLALTSLTGPLLWWANRRTVAVEPEAAQYGAVATDVPALRLAAAAAGAADTDRRLEAPWDGTGCLAVAGPEELALSVARAIVLGELGTRGECDVTVRGRHLLDWAWLVWTAATSAAPQVAPTAARPGAPRRSLVVVDGPDDGAEVARWRAHAPATQRLLWVARGTAPVPAWCHSVLDVTTTGSTLRCGDRAPRTVPLVGVRADVAEAHVRALARTATRSPVSPKGGPGLTLTAELDRCPDDVALGALPGVPMPDPGAVRAAWASTTTDLRTPFGSGPDGDPVTLDLVRDGPHAVVAGTTGAGKSELLTTLVLGLALAHPPERLAVLLVDFKGGTGLPGLAGLPHVVGRLSDLDAAGARRVLLGLGAELRRRERIIANVGVRDVAELPSAGAGGPPPPRLVVVIDEFRALADDLPDLVPGLARVAAQGRSLGVHLVLATQRPAGAVPAELRANVSLRVALRVVDAADSVDLVGVADAARIDSTTPGRALLVLGGGAARAVQVARAGATAERQPVRLATPATELLTASSDRPWTPSSPDLSIAPDPVARWVAAATEAAVGLAPPDVPWLPELPERVEAAQLAAGAGLPLAMADVPEEQRRATVRWDPDQGHLLVLGGPRSGRSTALVAVGRQALAAGRQVHALGLPPWAVAALHAGAPGRLGTVAPTADVVTAARLLEALARGPRTTSRPVLLVDGVDQELDLLGTLARGAAAQQLTSLWERSDPTVSLVASAPVSPLAGRLLGAFADRLVLGVADPTLDALAGVPSALAAPRVVPGRAVHVRAAGAVLCQLALPDAAATFPPSGRRGAPMRLALPPSTAPWAGARATRTSDGRLHVPLGLGGDGHGVVEVDLADSLLIAGPAGSGRTTALRAVMRALDALGIATCSLSALLDRGQASPAAGVPGPLGLVGARRQPGAADDAGEPRRHAGPERATAGLVVVMDDLDELERADPHAVQELADRLSAQRREGSGAAEQIRVVAATSTAHAVTSFRGLVPVLLRARRILVLDPSEPGSLDLLGAQARWLVNPAGEPPGRGVLRRDRTVVHLQVWEPSGA